MFKILICLNILLILNSCESITNKCLFRGTCGSAQSSITGDFYPIPCVYTGDPKPLQNETMVENLKQFAPELFADGNQLFCCDDQTVSAILNQISIAKAMLERCPSSFVNFAKVFFHMSCGANQVDYLDVTKTVPAQTDPKKTMVSELTYYVTDNFANNVYNSCKDVQMPSAAAKVIALMCGSAGLDCTPYKFLSYLGQRDPSPMQIDFKIYNKTEIIVGSKTFYPQNSSPVSCASPAPGYSTSACNCVDCPVTCVKPRPYPEPSHY